MCRLIRTSAKKEAKLVPAQLEAQMLAAEESSRNAERLKTLYDSGVITEEEYNRATGGAPQSAQAASGVAGGIDIEKLARLKQLLDAGVLTEEEYLEEITKSIK